MGIVSFTYKDRDIVSIQQRDRGRWTLDGTPCTWRLPAPCSPALIAERGNASGHCLGWAQPLPLPPPPPRCRSLPPPPLPPRCCWVADAERSKMGGAALVHPEPHADSAHMHSACIADGLATCWRAFKGRDINTCPNGMVQARPGAGQRHQLENGAARCRGVSQLHCLHYVSLTQQLSCWHH